MAVETQAILDWVDENRPDLLDHIRKIIHGSDDALGQGLFLLLAIGFEAGQEYAKKGEHRCRTSLPS